MEDRELLSILINVLDKLLPEDRVLWQCMVRGEKKQDIADKLNLTIDGVYYREKRLRGILRSNPALRSFFAQD
jgi:DNA-directed RNA polymerase specialized sigma24 family protein